jgi:hypothetical protein
MYNPTSPKTLKRVFEKLHYKLVASDSISWLLECNGHVIVISQTMKLVPSDVIESIAGPAEIGEEAFNELVQEIEKPIALGAAAKAAPTAAPMQASAEPPPSKRTKFTN